ncbi:hypothetical protein AVEN_120261-1 [Araneus ventricosus]|uniref:Uncharacterized protein n=1 Tax=Araneus ventricosus TaxID=182803 RepID=A0A4Y2KM04_ARAVE|nr:hypothetical protein AVEN_120261-1 [Araneus ventricosus]
MSLQSLFLLCNEHPLWHFPQKETSFTTVEDLLGDEPFNFYAPTDFGFRHKFFDLSLVRIRIFAVCFRKISSEVTWARPRNSRRATKTVTNVSRKKQRKSKPMITEVNENRGITVLTRLQLNILPLPNLFKCFNRAKLADTSKPLKWPPS